MIRFFYNGLKTSDCEKLQKAYYSQMSDDMICVTADGYADFSKEIKEAFKVINNTDIMTDYFERDRFDVEKSHPMYNHVKKAMTESSLKFYKRRHKKFLTYPRSSRVEEALVDCELKIEECQNIIKEISKL